MSWQSLLTAWQSQRGALFPWAPVALALGIGLYFTRPVEPELPIYLLCLAGMTLMGAAALRGPVLLRPVATLLALVALGLVAAGLRAHKVAAPPLEWRYYGPVEGRVVLIDRSQSDAVRLTLDRVVLEDLPPAKTPARVRLSLHGPPGAAPAPGTTVITTAHLSPPGGAVEPGGFDFQRYAWFKRLGAVGYTRLPVLTLAPPGQTGWAVAVYRLRMQVSGHIRAAIPGGTGGFAAAIVTGDRSAIEAEALEDLRASNLAHLLAISGLHMGLLTGFVFAALRYGLVLLPIVGLRWPVKKIAAGTALVAAAAYLVLSGAAIATERAFIMVAVMLLAVLADRRALTLRAVAIAAVIVLLLRPEALTGPGFQMSFAATTALVAVFGVLRGRDLRLPRPLKPVFAVVVSSAVAGAATAPFGAAHFNQIAHFGLLANLLSVPVMGTIVMPAAVVAAVLAPLGLSGAAFWVMGRGIDWILLIAAWVAGFDGALSHVPTPGPWVLPLLSLGALTVILWRGRARWAGLAPVAAALILWSQVQRPDVLIAPSGGLIGVMTAEGRALSKPRGDGFAARSWMENDGDPVPQEEAHARADALPEGTTRISLGPLQIAHATGKAARAAVPTCAPDVLLVVNMELDTPAGCPILGPVLLRRLGAVALHLDDAGQVQWRATRHAAGQRLWNRHTRPAPVSAEAVAAAFFPVDGAAGPRLVEAAPPPQ